MRKIELAFVIVALAIGLIDVSQAQAAKKIKAPKPVSSNGNEIPPGTWVATFKVGDTTKARKALKDFDGVVDVVKVSRRHPASKWVLVYFDASKTSEKALLEQLKGQGCKDAQQILDKPILEEQVSIKLANPVCGPGDIVQCLVAFPEGEHGKVRVAPPPQWIPLPLSKPAEDGKLRLDIQSPKRIRAGRVFITILITPEGKKERPVKVPVEIGVREAGK